MSLSPFPGWALFMVQRLPEARSILAGRAGISCLIRLALAWRYLRTNHLDSALIHLAHVIQYQPRCPRAHLFLGQISLRSGDHARGVEHLRIATEAGPARRDALVALGHAVLGHDPEAATRCYREAAREPGPSETIAGALAAEADGRHAESLSIWDKLLYANPFEGAAMRGLIRTVREVHRDGALRWWTARLSSLASSPDRQAVDHRQTRGQASKTRSTRVVCLSGNWNFAKGLIDYLGQIPETEVHTLTVREAVAWTIGGIGGRFSWGRQRWASTLSSKVEREMIECADVIFVEWCNDTAVWLTRLGPARPRLVIRLLGYEADGPWPVVVDWNRADALVFLSEFVRERVVDAIELNTFPHLKSVTVPLAISCLRFSRPKRNDAWQTLGLIGWSTLNKDALVAVRILRDLRARGGNWRLRLLGRPPTPWTADQRTWLRELDGEIEAAGTDTISLDPWTEDVPEWLTGVGFILSTSRSESFHAAVAEGMASGAVPVVRRWPVCQRWRGAERQYPNALLFDEVDEAVAQILALSANPAALAEASAQASREAMERFDSSVALPKLAGIILGTELDGREPPPPR